MAPSTLGKPWHSSLYPIEPWQSSIHSEEAPAQIPQPLGEPWHGFLHPWESPAAVLQGFSASR